MNIDDVTKVDLVEPHRIMEAIFNRQLELMVKYDKIEAANGFHIPHPPYNLDNKYVQHRIKELAWRATEELAEALENRHFDFNTLREWQTQWDSSSEVRHLFEELADAIHFIVEMTLVAGWDFVSVKDASPYWYREDIEPRFVLSDFDGVTKGMSEVIIALGLMCNCLKNKPWKSTHMATDAAKFKERLRLVWLKLAYLCASMGLSLNDVFLLYMKKSEVNKFRQRSNY